MSNEKKLELNAWPGSAKMTEILERELFRHNCHNFYNYVLGDPYREDSKKLRSLNPNVQNITRDEAAKMTKTDSTEMVVGENPHIDLYKVLHKISKIAAEKGLLTTGVQRRILPPGMSPEDVNYDSLAATKARGYPVFDGVPAPTPPNRDDFSCVQGDGWCGSDFTGQMMRRSYAALCNPLKSRAAVTIKRVCTERKSKSEPIDLNDWIQRPMGVPCTIPKRFKTEL